MVDWFATRARPIRAVEHGVAEVDAFEDSFTGPRTFDRIDYPIAEVLPQETAQTDGNEFAHTIYANLYFERERGQDYVDDVLHPTAAVIDEVLAALKATDCVVTFVPAAIEDYAGELDDTLVLLVSIRFEMSTVVDLATI